MLNTTVIIPDVHVELTVDQLIAAVRQLGPVQKEQVARALTDTALDAELTQLIAELYSRPPDTAISDADILHEVMIVRQQRR